MFKKTMKFDNLEGEEVIQAFYFNYNKKEVAELLEFGRLEEKLKLLSTPVEESGLSQQENNQQAYDIFQDLILNAYGEKGSDNVTFIKNERTKEYFRSHVAFVELVFEFLENPALAAEFIEKCLPVKLVEQAKKDMAAEQGKPVTSETLSEMVQEAQRRQQDPATRIEPGLDAAVEAGVVDPSSNVTKLAQDVASTNADPIADKAPADLTPEDVDFLTNEEFKRLDPQQLSRETLMAAMRRKTQG